MDLSFWSAERYSNPRIALDSGGRPTLPLYLWSDSHCFSQTLDFGRFNLNASLPPSAALEVRDRVGLTANNKFPCV